MRRLVWSHPARRDLYMIAADYGQIDPDLPLILLERIVEAPLALLNYPDMGSPTGRRGIRKWQVKRTSFVLLYLARGADIEIWRVVHAASDWPDAEP